LPGERALLVGDEVDLADARAALERGGGRVVATVPTSALRRVLGRRGVTGAVVTGATGEHTVAIDLLVIGDRTPDLDLPLAAGAAVEQRGGVLVPVLDDAGRTSVPGLSVVGSAVGSGPRGTPPPMPAGRALVCFCEDVHADEITAQVDAGYGDPELVKRRTGALTGPCQGKYCLQAFSAMLDSAGSGAVHPPTARPPLRPIRLGDLVAAEEIAEP
jgi:hypothetical protein